MIGHIDIGFHNAGAMFLVLKDYVLPPQSYENIWSLADVMNALQHQNRRRCAARVARRWLWLLPADCGARQTRAGRVRLRQQI